MENSPRALPMNMEVRKFVVFLFLYLRELGKLRAFLVFSGAGKAHRSPILVFWNYKEMFFFFSWLPPR